MYTVKVPFKDLYDHPQNQTIHFNLFEREVFKLMGELQTVFGYIDRWQKEENKRDLDTAEVVDFYNNFEEVVLAAYGKPVDDGLGFDHADRYKFEDSACFNAYMMMCLKDPQETGRLVNGIMPDGLEEMVRTADENLVKAAKETDDDDIRAELERLRTQLAAQQQPKQEG